MGLTIVYISSAHDLQCYSCPQPINRYAADSSQPFFIYTNDFLLHLNI